MSLLDYWPTTGIIREMNGTNTDGEGGGDGEGGENSAESCLERVDNLSIGQPCCSGCGHGMGEGDPQLNVGDDCPLCGASGSVVDGQQMADQVRENAHSYWGE